ncbi:MAG: hypothetical protein V3U96_04505 [Paracoccaceae bacterium]
MKVTCDMSVTSARHRPVGMSTPWFTPWNSPLSSAIPGLVLDFSDGSYGAGGTVGTLSSTLVLNRASDGSRTDATGAIQVVGPNIGRIEHDPTTLAPIGLLLEAERSNLFLQSASPADQTIAVTADPYVLSFYGTGTVTLADAHVAVVPGTGAYPARTQVSFTPTAGNLTLTLSGSIVSPQLELGAIASTYIPTLAAPVLRADDIATVPLGAWFDTTEGTLVFDGSLDSAQANDRIIEIDAGGSTTRLSILWNTVLGKPQFQVWEAGVLQAAIAPSGSSIALGDPFRVAVTFKANEFGISMNGSAVVNDTSGTMATGLSTLRLGRSVSGAQGLMLAESIVYYPQRLADAEIQALST